MNLRTAEGWRRLGLSVLIVAAPVGLGLFGFVIFDAQAFVDSAWAIWVLLACLLIPYSILYTADMLRRREARRGDEPAGDSSALILEGASNSDQPVERISASYSGSGSSPGWIWVALLLVGAYAVFRFVWALTNGAELDWTAAVALVAAAVLAIILPGVIGWQRFTRSVRQIGNSVVAWPTFRTDQFAAALRQSRPGAIVPQDLVLSKSPSAVSVWTTEREPKLILSLPCDATTQIRAVTIADRLGSTGVRLEHHHGDQSYAFELVVRRKGMWNYFRTTPATAQLCADEISSGRSTSEK